MDPLVCLIAEQLRDLLQLRGTRFRVGCPHKVACLDALNGHVARRGNNQAVCSDKERQLLT